MSEELKNDVGSILKAEREARGITLEVVQEATKIPIDSLRAIEGGYKVRTLTSFYYRSFVKLYAQYLGLDPAPVLALIPDHRLSPRISVQEKKPVDTPGFPAVNTFAGKPRVPSVVQQAVPVVLAGIIVLGCLAGLVFLIRKVIAHAEVQPAITRVGLSRKEVRALDRSRFVEPKKAPLVVVPKILPKPALKSEVHVDEVKRIPVPEPVKKTEQVPAARNADETPAVVKPARKVAVTVRATVTAWLKVKVDGAVAFEGSLKKGSSESWNGIKKIEISGKNVDQLEFEYNGKPQGKLARRDIKIKKVVVTPESLSVEK